MKGGDELKKRRNIHKQSAGGRPKAGQEFVKKDLSTMSLGVLVAPGRRYWVSLIDLNEDILYKLALLGLAQRLRQIVSKNSRAATPEERERKIALLMASLKAGQWRATLPTSKEARKDEVLKTLEDADARILPRLIEVYEREGVFKRLGITEAEVERARKMAKAATTTHWW